MGMGRGSGDWFRIRMRLHKLGLISRMGCMFLLEAIRRFRSKKKINKALRLKGLFLIVLMEK